MISRERISELYEEYGRNVFAFIYSFVKSQDLAEDILHDVFVKLIKYTMSRDVDEHNIKALLFTIAKNMCMDHFRKLGKARLVALDETFHGGQEDDTGKKLEEKEAVRIMRSAVSTMDVTTRSIYHMRTELNMTYREIAVNLSISERTAKRKMSALIKRVSLVLKKKGLLLPFFYVIIWTLLR